MSKKFNAAESLGCKGVSTCSGETTGLSFQLSVHEILCVMATNSAYG